MEPQPNPLQELQIKEKEKSMENGKTETKISQPNYKQKTIQPVKKKIIMNQKDNQRNKIIRETSSVETETPRVSKIRIKKTNGQEVVTQLKKDNKSKNQCSPTKNLKLKLRKLEIQEQRCEEPTKIKNKTDIQWDKKNAARK